MQLISEYGLYTEVLKQKQQLKGDVLYDCKITDVESFHCNPI